MNKLTNNINALILIGGKSTRMGTDKSQLVYYNQPQRKHLFNLLIEILPKENIYFSVRDQEQVNEQKIIVDKYPNLGPFGAIYAAFEQDNSKPWLILAVDIPFINIDVLNLLINNRNTSKIATTFQGKNKNYPEPLITIWEPKVIPLLKENLKLKNYSLVNLLLQNEVEIIPIKKGLLKNVNTKEAYKKILQKIKK